MKKLIVTCLLSFVSASAFAQSHAGQLDTDGILSIGEVQNPRINYNHAQRDYERRGDERVENPYNDDAAAADRRSRNNGGDRERRWDRRDERSWDRGRRSWLDRGADYPWSW